MACNTRWCWHTCVCVCVDAWLATSCSSRYSRMYGKMWDVCLLLVVVVVVLLLLLLCRL